MILPPEYAWLELVVIGAVAVFVADLIGNFIDFHGRFANALTTAIVFVVLFGLSIHLRYGTVLLMKWGFAVMKTPPA
jgi:hypothetical protein